jgi:hypothetical protein
MFTILSAGQRCAAAAGLRTLETGGNAVGTWLTALDRRVTMASAYVAAPATS